MIGPLGFAGKNLSRRGFHAFLAFVGLTLTVTSITFLLLLGQGLYTRLGVVLTSKGTFGINWLFFGYLLISLVMIVIVGFVSVSYLVSSMVNQRRRDIAVVKAAGSLPRRLFSYAFTEGLLVIASSVITGAVVGFLIYLGWAWPSPNLAAQVGPFANAGATILVVVPIVSFLLSYSTARFQIGKILKSSTVNELTSQMSSLDFKTLGKPVLVRRLGSAFNLATRNVSRDRELNRTLLRIGICIFLSVIVLTGALISADTSKSYVQRAMPANTLLVASPAMIDQYVRLGTAFSSTAPILAFNYSDQRYTITLGLIASLRNTSGVQRVDTRLITMSSVDGYVRAHLVTNETSGNFNNEYVPEVHLGSTQALIVGLDPGNVIGDWYTSNGFLQSNDNQSTMIAGDSLVGSIVQQPFSLAQVGTFGTRFDVRSALVDPLNAGRVLYARVEAVQAALRVIGYNILLVKTDGNPATAASVGQVASSIGLAVDSMATILNSNLAFLDNTWSYFLILPLLTIVLTSGILLSYLTTNFSRRFNDYLILRVIGAKRWYGLKLMLWEAWGLLGICLVIAVPLAFLISIFFILPEAIVSMFDLEFSAALAVGTLTLVGVISAFVYSRRLGRMTVKDLRL